MNINVSALNWTRKYKTVFTEGCWMSSISSGGKCRTNINIWKEIWKHTTCPLKHEEEEEEEEGSFIVPMTHDVHREDLFLCFHMLPQFPFFKYLRVKFAELLISASSPTPATSVHSAPREYSWASAHTGQYRRDERARWRMAERGRDKGRTRRRRNHFCFHKLHMSCTHSPRSQWLNAVM